MLPTLPEQAVLQMNTLLGMCAGRLNDVQTAGAAFKNAFKINLSLQVFDPGAAYQYVQFLLQSGLDTEAESIIAEILKRAPRFGPAHVEMAKSFDHSGQPAQAIMEAQLALAGEGNTPSSIRAAHVLLAKCYFLLGKTSGAEEEQRWIESNPAFPKQGR
jgi:tetratricopeptide (TPR) repeat protein